MSPPAPAGPGAGPVMLAGSPGELWEKLAAETASGRRFAGLMATQRPGGLVLSAHLAAAGGSPPTRRCCRPAPARIRH